jgi:hypothetical protein
MLTLRFYLLKPATTDVAEKRFNTVILSPFAVILSEAMNLALPLRVNCAKDLALCASG